MREYFKPGGNFQLVFRRLPGQVILPAMTTYRIELDELELGQLLDGLECRADSWEKTACYHRTGEAPPDFLIEECSDADEADEIASRYRSIISKIEKQRDAQR